MRKTTICICQNKDADQLRGDREADQRLCFRYIDSAIPLLSKSEVSSFYPSSVAAQPGLCRTRSETRMLVFSSLQLISVCSCYMLSLKFIFVAKYPYPNNFEILVVSTFGFERLFNRGLN